MSFKMAGPRPAIFVLGEPEDLHSHVGEGCGGCGRQAFRYWPHLRSRGRTKWWPARALEKRGLPRSLLGSFSVRPCPIWISTQDLR